MLRDFFSADSRYTFYVLSLSTMTLRPVELWILQLTVSKKFLLVTVAGVGTSRVQSPKCENDFLAFTRNRIF